MLAVDVVHELELGDRAPWVHGLIGEQGRTVGACGRERRRAVPGEVLQPFYRPGEVMQPLVLQPSYRTARVAVMDLRFGQYRVRSCTGCARSTTDFSETQPR